MKLFLRKFFRDLREAKGQFLSVVAVVIIGVMFYTGLYSALEGLSGAGGNYFAEYRLADLWSAMYRAPEGAVEQVESIPGVKMAEGRIVKDVRISMDDHEAIIRLISLPDIQRKVVNDVELKSGSYFPDDSGNQCIVSEDFFNANHLEIGQIIEPIVNGERIKLSVVGTGKSPEYTYEVRDSAELIPNPEKFGVVYVKKSYLQSVLDFKGSINDIAVLLNKDGDRKAVKDEMKRILDPYGLISTIERKDQLSYSMFDTDVNALKSLAAIFPMLFFIASAVIIYITMTRMIENQRTQMGVLKAMGYRNLDIMLHYQTYPLLVGILGSIIGAFIGVFLVGELLLEMFNTLYNIPTRGTAVHMNLVLPAALMALLFCMAAGYNACRKELHLEPAESMRPKPPASGRQTLVERIRPLWERINFSWKIILRNLFRYKRRSVMASVGIIFSMALLLVSLGMKSSMDYMMEYQYSEVQRFDLKVTLADMMNVNELGYIRSIDHVASAEPVMETGLELTNGWKKKDIGMIALERGSQLYGVYNQKGQPAILPSEGILLTEQLMKKLGINEGDQVTLRFYYPGKNEEKDKKSVIVKGISRQLIGQYAICSSEYLDDLLGEGFVANAVHIRLDSPRYEKEVAEKLGEILTISTVQSNSEIKSNMQKTLNSMNGIMMFMVLGASILAVAIIYNITNINIFERRRELATLSVLGFTSDEQESLVFNENFIISVFGLLAGMPLGRFLTGILVDTQTNDTMQLPTILRPSSYFAAGIMIIVFTAAANLLLKRKISSINMVESLKSAE